MFQKIVSRQTLQISLLFLVISGFSFGIAAQTPEQIAPGVWRVRYGEQETTRPTDFKEPANSAAMEKMPHAGTAPALLSLLHYVPLQSGISASLPLSNAERLYGFGLQVNSFQQRGLRREIRVNSRTIGNIGFSHAPLPFFISSNGYGILVNSSRYVTFYAGSQHRLNRPVAASPNDAANATKESDLYNGNNGKSDLVEWQVKGAKGIEIIYFEGPSIKQVMERYNLFSGGGAIPPLWALGFKYRAKNTFDANEVAGLSAYFREKHIPCDMFGLEPGWQSASYSCSYKWNPVKYPNPDSLLTVMHNRHYKLNLWEHAYVHPSSPIYDSILPFSGNYTVWNGAVPDFSLPAAQRIFGGYHKTNFIDKNISAFKLDECDAAYYDEANAEWSFPDITRFPSGMDGEEMRQLFGLLYQRTILDQYKKANKRTMLEVRASGLFAAPYSAALYTDMYDQADFVRMICNAGFSGLNWSPEVRQTRNDSDLVRRLQTTLMSAHMVVDCWFLKNLPWFQYDREKNNRDEALPNFPELEQMAKDIINLRMRLIPYLYNAFAQYHFYGTPPFRPLVMDFPGDRNCWTIDDQYMMGNDILCAPFLNGKSARRIYLPAGNWYDFNTNKKYPGGQFYQIAMPLEQVPMFVREGSLLPLAKPVEYITASTVFEIECRVYGKPVTAQAGLFEDDGETFNFEKGDYNYVSLEWYKGKGHVTRHNKSLPRRYKPVSWKVVP